MRIQGYLNETSVREIFAARPRPSPVTGSIPARTDLCNALAQQYRVSNKTIRDIWKRKSWAKVTAAMDEGSQNIVTDFHIATPPAGQPSTSCEDQPSTPDSAITVKALSDFSFYAAAHSSSLLEDDIDALPSQHSTDLFQCDWQSALSRIHLETAWSDEA